MTPPNLLRERIVRAALELLEAMGAQGEAYEEHERRFRELVSMTQVRRGAWRVVHYARGMITDHGPRASLKPEVRRANGLNDPIHDEQCNRLALGIIAGIRALSSVLEGDRRRRLNESGPLGMLLEDPESEGYASTFDPSSIGPAPVRFSQAKIPPIPKQLAAKVEKMARGPAAVIDLQAARLRREAQAAEDAAMFPEGLARGEEVEGFIGEVNEQLAADVALATFDPAEGLPFVGTPDTCPVCDRTIRRERGRLWCHQECEHYGEVDERADDGA